MGKEGRDGLESVAWDAWTPCQAAPRQGAQ